LSFVLIGQSFLYHTTYPYSRGQLVACTYRAMMAAMLVMCHSGELKPSTHTLWWGFRPSYKQ